MNTVATICARGESEGLPRKNIKTLLGKPLITYSIEQALGCDLIDQVYVSTDDEEIANIALSAGAMVPFLRPAELARNITPKIDVISHVISWLVEHDTPVDKIVDLDPTSPLRDVSDICACLELLDDTTDVVLTAFESEKNPYFNMIEKKENSNYGLVKRLNNIISSRQLAPKVYSLNASIYAWHLKTLDKGLWDGKIKLHIMPREKSIDIDGLLDFKIVEMLLKEKMRNNG